MPAPPDALTADEIRQELARLLASPTFASSGRLSDFLRYIVEGTLSDRATELKESVIGVEVFARSADYDPRIDPVVRVMAGRLRQRLQSYYKSTGSSDAVRIDLPKGGYVPQFERNLQPKPSPTWLRSFKRRHTVRAGVAALLTLAGMGLWAVRRAPAPAPLKVEVLTAFPGRELFPSLSPDGNLVAFQWTNGHQEGPSDIWVKAVKGEALRRITETPAHEWGPVWSPDGREIAFVRASRDERSSVFVVSELGGTERKIGPGENVAWGPDAKSILIRDREGEGPYEISHVDLDTLKRRRIMRLSSGTGDWLFAVSPDGSMLAFVRNKRPGVGDVYVVPLCGGEPRRVTDWNDMPANVAWTPDSREIVYSVRGQLWRVPARGSEARKGTQIPLASAGLVRQVSISRPASGQPVRLAAVSAYVDISLRLVDLHAPRSDALLTAVRPLADSTIPDWPGRFSPDNRRIAFASYRTGNGASLWTIDINDKELRRVTIMDIAELQVGSWSPTGQEIAFDASVGGNSDIYVVRDDGTRLRRLTEEPSSERHPWCSRDGRWIYFSSDRTGRHEVWRVSTDGSEPRQITRGGGYEPIESPDGKFLYYSDSPPPGWSASLGKSRLMRVPVEGGEETLVLDSVRYGMWQVIDKGIVVMNLPGAPVPMSVNLFRFEDGRTTKIGDLPFRISGVGDLGRIAASSDGRWLLTNVSERLDFDLMLIDNFR